MYPFERYFSTLLPYDKDISAFKPCPRVHQFQQDAFLSFLQEQGTKIPIRNSRLTDWSDLYK